MTQEGKPTGLADVIRRGMRVELAGAHTMIPARVERVTMDGEKIKSVDCQPHIKFAYLDEQQERQVESLPQVPSCPVSFLGAGGYRVTVPLQVGDVGHLLFSEASLDRWLGSGGEVDPEIDHRFALSDGVFVPGLRDFSSLWNAPADRMTLGKDDGLQLHIDGQRIKIGSNLDVELDKVALYTPLQSWMGQAQAAFASHTHPTPAGPSGPPAGALPPAPSDLGSGSVYAKKT